MRKYPFLTLQSLAFPVKVTPQIKGVKYCQATATDEPAKREEILAENLDRSKLSTFYRRGKVPAFFGRELLAPPRMADIGKWITCFGPAACHVR